MKLSKSIEARRTPPPLAREMLRQPEEHEKKFDARSLLTGRDWQKALAMMEAFYAHQDQSNALCLWFYARITDQDRSEELTNRSLCVAADWLKSLGTTAIESTVEKISADPVRLKIQTKIMARHLFPDQPALAVSSQELQQMITSISTRNAPKVLRALEIEFYKQSCPEASVVPTSYDLLLNDERLTEIVQEIESNMNTVNIEVWGRNIEYLLMLKAVFPETFRKIKLNQNFWDKAVSMFKETQDQVRSSLVLLRYTARLQLLAAEELHLDKRGNFHLVIGGEKIRPAPVLPARDLL